MRWSEYEKTKEFKELVKEVDEDLNQNEVKFSQIHDSCEDFLKEIGEINSKFHNSFNREVTEA